VLAAGVVLAIALSLYSLSQQRAAIEGARVDKVRDQP
jgi:hypothetical protein